jgi:hypothetical protein
LPARLYHSLGGLFGLLALVVVRDTNAGAFPSEGDGRCSANACGTPCYKDDAIVQPKIHGSAPFLPGAHRTVSVPLRLDILLAS